MRLVLYTHSLVSDWNHGNAHFLRGVLRELQARGHETLAMEPADGWSRANLIEQNGPVALDWFAKSFPELTSQTYGAGFDHGAALDGADVVLVHEWTDPALIADLGRMRRDGAKFTLLFHDTHHRAVSEEHEIGGLDLDGYDGVLAFGEVLRELYLRRGWGRRVFTWHEAADVRLFHPRPEIEPERDLVWIGNWGDGERSEELRDFLIEPVKRLGLSGTVHGVRYPHDALAALADAGIDYRGWVASASVPEVYARHRMTVHVPRRPYTQSLPGIPTIRMFEALACGIPLISAPWSDSEGLFRAGEDFLFVRDGGEMESAMKRVIAEPDFAAALAASGLETVLARHTCAHRVDELLAVLDSIGNAPARNDRMETA
ncbi:CgeB family protein [Terrihabitans rhizophilus]|uniref:Glycosyltransferase n=1 Tax=Terrihabitans rhizophilus TaxID=3092662 RepID=A0ABU4RP64_9HYPH|nr:glycosyltransferase [Terrihabitans sp. PJ23]MDX6805440.1 glycosyltransferase [Terrihabitans sp. PJ23]